MNAINTGLVMLGGGLGALCRWIINYWMPSVSGFPWATTFVNLLGCLLIGWVSSMLYQMDERLQLLLIMAFLGAFTTFSTYALDLIRMGEGQDWIRFGLYFVLSNAGGLFCVLVGRRLPEWI